LDDVLSNIGFGLFQRTMFFLCGIGWLADSMWLIGVSVLLPRAQQTFQVPDSQIGIMSSCFFAGMMGGATAWGFAADRFGRKLPFFLCPLLSTVCAYCVALAPSFPFLCVLLFPLGFNAAGSIPVDSSLLAEFLPPANKYWVTLLAVFYCAGDVTSSGLAWIILPSTSCDPMDEISCPPGHNRGWRYFFAILATLQLVFFIIRIIAYRQRETPSYLLTNGRREEAIEVLWNIARKNGHVQADSAKLGIDRLTLNPVSPPASRGKSKAKRGTFSQLFKGRVAATTTLIVWSQWFLMSLGYMLYASFLPKLLEQRQAAETTEGDAGLAGGYRDLFIYALCGLPASFIARYAVNSRLGRKGTLTAFMWTSASLLLAFTLVKSHVGAVMIIGTVNIMSTVAWAGLSTYAAEVFAVDVRGTGTGIASALQRMAGIIGPIITGLLMMLNKDFPLWGASCILGLAGLCGILLPIETK
ncbi:major facilitator superfamily domain-containing protein, partial [Piptocephalis cylindrospora]